MSLNKSLLTLITEQMNKKPSKPRVPKQQTDTETNPYYVDKSGIAGKGAFAKQFIPKGSTVDMLHQINQPGVDYDFTQLGRSYNHSETPNTVNQLDGNKRFMVASQDIMPGQELTGNYRMQPDLEQPQENWKMRMGGGLLSKTITCKGCGHSWKATDGGSDPLSCHNCGAEVKMQQGGMIKRADGSYSKRGLWDNIRANSGSKKKPTPEMLEQERKIKAEMQYGGLWDSNRTAWVDSVNAANMDKNFVQRMYKKNGPQMYLPGDKRPSTHFMESGDSRAYPTVVQRPGNKFLEWMNQNNSDGAMNYALDNGQYIQFPNDEQATWYGQNGYKTGKGVTIGKKQQGGDSTLENIAEIFDPTGISSWDDVYRSYKNPKDKWYDTAIEAVGAVPLLGKFGKLTKAGIHLKKYKGLEKTLFNMLPQKTGVSKAITTLGKIGRGSDAVQATYNLPDAKLLPGQGPLNDQARRQRVFDAVRPSTYWDEKNYARYMTGTKRAEFDDPRSEEAFAQYMGVNNKPKYLSPSKYRPSISKDPNAKYYQVDKDLENDIFESYKDKVKMNEILQANEDGVINNIEYDDRMEDDMSLYLTDTDKKFNRQKQVSRARALGHFTVSHGKDDKGEYLSYYDKYDFPGVIQNEMKGDPYQVYGRMYYPKKADGGQTRDDREMVNGIADILSQVQDPQNRAQIAANMMQDFKREKVTYNPDKFMQMSKLQNGGGWLDQYQEGGTKYTVKPGQYLSQIAKANNVSVDDLVMANKIGNPDLIRAGQELMIPEGANSFHMPGAEGYVGFDGLMERQQKLSALPARDMVRQFRSQNQVPGNYAVVDKKTGMMSMYDPSGKELSSISVGTGKDIGDQVTINTKGPNRRNSTPAGIFTLTNKGSGRDSYAKHYGDNIWEMVDQNGVQQATALHQVPNELPYRNALIGDKNPLNNRLSNGCINCRKPDFDRTVEKYLGKGSQVYILPEDENNRFVVKNNRIALTGDKFDPNVSYTKKDLKAKDLQIKYATSQFGDAAPNVQRMTQSLVNQKQKLMKDLNIDNDTYNELAQLTLGVAGQESDYGDNWRYKAKDSGLGQFAVTDVKQFVNIMSLKNPLKTSPNSRGFTQIKYNSQNKEVRDLFAKYGIKSEEDLTDPAKSNVAALIMMGHMYNNELPQLKGQMEKLGLSKSDAILYLNQGKRGEITKGTATPNKNLYIKSVKNYAKRFVLNQKQQDGGSQTNWLEKYN